MKMIQTLWTKPGLKAGWVDEIYHFMSWTYSCLQLRKFYDEVELYTDSLGKEILIDILNLPYTKVNTDLDHFNYPTHLWAATKILSYGKQDAPFLHLDGDVFLMAPFNKKKLNQPLVYQNREHELNTRAFYTVVFEDLLSVIPSGKEIPDWIKNYQKNNIIAFCAGVFGGTNIPFFKKHTELAFSFFDEFSEEIKKMETPKYANHIAEQVLSYYLAEKQEIKHDGFFESTYCADPKNPDQEDTSGYFAVDHFGLSPYGKKYVHYIGGFKSSLKECKILARRLQLDYPEYYNRVLHNIDKIKHLKKESYIPSTPSLYSIKNSKEVQKTKSIFPRTLHLARTILKKELNNTLSTSDFILKYKNLILETKNEVIIDAFRFEEEVYQYINEMECDEVYTKQELLSSYNIDKIYSFSQPDIDSYEISLNNLIGFVDVKWEWTNIEEDPFLKSFISPNEMLCILIPDFFTKLIYKEVVTELCRIVIYVFRSKQSYKEGYSSILKYVNIQDEDKLKKQVFECIAYLIGINVLTVSQIKTKKTEKEIINK